MSKRLENLEKVASGYKVQLQTYSRCGKPIMSSSTGALVCELVEELIKELRKLDERTRKVPTP